MVYYVFARDEQEAQRICQNAKGLHRVPNGYDVALLAPEQLLWLIDHHIDRCKQPPLPRPKTLADALLDVPNVKLVRHKFEREHAQDDDESGDDADEL